VTADQRRHQAWSIERCALVVMVIVAFTMSAHALYDVGVGAGLGHVLAAGVPLLLDGFAILAARVVIRLDSRLARSYPWTVLIIVGTVSVWANAIHANPVTVGPHTLSAAEAQVVAALPPVVLGLAFHMVQMVSRADQRARPRSRTPHRHQAGVGNVTLRSRVVNAPRHAEASQPANKRPRLAAVHDDRLAVLRAKVRAAAADGRRVTGQDVAGWLGVSPRTGRRRLAALVADEPELEGAAGER
jgi:hypothetical protein